MLSLLKGIRQTRSPYIQYILRLFRIILLPLFNFGIGTRFIHSGIGSMLLLAFQQISIIRLPFRTRVFLLTTRQLPSYRICLNPFIQLILMYSLHQKQHSGIQISLLYLMEWKIMKRLPSFRYTSSYENMYESIKRGGTSQPLQ